MSDSLLTRNQSSGAPQKRVVQGELKVVSGRKSVLTRLREVWRYRQLLWSLVRKELKVKYKGSTLGFIWTLLNPILKLAVWWFVFTVIQPNGVPLFVVFLLSGLLIWNFFSEALASGTGSVVGNSSILKKVSFPREILPLASVGAAAINFLLQTVVLLGALLLFRHAPAWDYLPLLIPALFTVILLAAALAVFLAAVNVKYRDVQHLLELALMLWFWLTPIVYPVGEVAKRATGDLAWLYEWVYLSNPITPVVMTFQRAIYGMTTVVNESTGGPLSVLPDVNHMWYLGHLGVVAVISGLLFLGAIKVFDRHEGDFAEKL